MKLQFKILTAFLIIPLAILANNGKLDGKYTKEKTVKKEFTVNSDALLKVDNSYGNIDVVTWNENRTVIEVNIKTKSDSEEKAQKKLDDITIEFSASTSLVNAKTLFNNKKDSWGFWGKNNNVSMEINYTIKIPMKNSVDIKNDYGSISINKIEGVVKVNCDYGQLLLGELLAANNELSFDYTNNSTIVYMRSGKINADYSSFVLEKGERLDLKADYTNSEINEIIEINYNSDYGKIIIGNAKNIFGRGDYVTNKIGVISGSLDLETDYGSIKVDRLTSSAKNVLINADYTGIKLGFENNYSFDFHIDLSYSSLEGKEDVTVLKSNEENNHKTYSGYQGTQGSGNTININSEYGGVTFTKINY